MSWIEKLYRTYENNRAHVANPNDAVPLLPLFHSRQGAQVNVVLDGEGNLKRASVVAKEDSQTIVPATEASAGRSGSKIAPHALFDTLQYVAGDYLSWGGNPNKKKNESGFEPYINALKEWVRWSSEPRLRAVLVYLLKEHLIRDLVDKRVLFGNKSGHLIASWDEDTDAPPIFRILRQASKKGQYEAFVRFSVEVPGHEPSELWNDRALMESWIEYYASLHGTRGLCYATGELISTASNHPKNIRFPGDGAKLISSNDTDGFTYLGRFTNANQACEVGTEMSQKAHSALSWLIARQGRRDGDQAVVAWAVSGAEIPDPMADSFSFLFGRSAAPAKEGGYTAQEVGLALSAKISGYSARLGHTDDVVVMALDSATPGRMAIRYYRELTGSEFLSRIETWHSGCCWRQNFGKDRVFVGAPAPRDIADTAFGTWRDGKVHVDDKIVRATVERLLPCIVDGAPLPRDLVESSVRRASSKNGIEPWGWEKALGIGCALFRYKYKERNYDMALERERKTRDYLYGRLLALAERMEGLALHVGGETRATNAEKLMQRFADRPYSTWLVLETGLSPYKIRLRANRPGFLHKIATEMDEVISAFDTGDFTSDRRLSGEFLLGYHCQREALRPASGKDDGQAAGDIDDATEEQQPSL